MKPQTAKILKEFGRALFKTLCVVAVIAAVMFYLGALINAENERAAGREWAKSQPALVTSQGIFTCRLEYDGAFVNKDKRQCITFSKVADLPEGAKYEMEIPEGVTEFVKR